jgi:hypothetical protein
MCVSPGIHTPEWKFYKHQLYNGDVWQTLKYRELIKGKKIYRQ